MNNEAQTIEEGRRVKAFLEDEAVKTAFINLEKQYFAEFKRAKTAVEREMLAAKCSALEEMVGSCLGLVQNGTLAQTTRDQREKVEERRKQQNPRSR